jgi:predicted DNA-binding transcriptional regulator AlpA
MERTSGTRLVRPAEADRRCAISESTRRRLIEANAFPKPIVLSRDKHGRAARIAFVEAELETWCRERVEADRGGATVHAAADAHEAA